MLTSISLLSSRSMMLPLRRLLFWTMARSLCLSLSIAIAIPIASSFRLSAVTSPVILIVASACRIAPDLWGM